MNVLPDGVWKSRWAIPIDRPPLFQAAIEVVSGVIRNLDTADKLDGQPHTDLGDVAILPTLVNAHTHLEFSCLNQPLGQRGMHLADWITKTIEARKHSPLHSAAQAIEQGIAEISLTGTSLVGEIATPPWPRKALSVGSDGLTIHSFAEVLGLIESRGQERFDAAVAHINQFAPDAGVSPHAPYSTPPNLILRCIELARMRNRAIAMHVAESFDERDFLIRGGGPFAETLEKLGLRPNLFFPWKMAEPIRWLIEKLSTAPRGLLIHGNDLIDTEIEALRQHKNLSVVFCPRTHDYFGHSRHPVDRLLRAGVNVALGTDSRASNPNLDVWGEVQFLLRHRQDLAPDAVVRMATSGGHSALTGTPGAGTLANGQPARLCCVPSTANTVDQLWQSLATTSVVRLANGLRPLN